MTVAALVILGPLVAAALILVLRRGAAGIALSGSVVAAIAALATLARAVSGVRDAATLPGLPGLPLRLTVDPLAAVLVTVVAVVALLVLVYAVGYMADEEGQGRFYAGMSCFAGAMATLVLAGDWLLFLASWELIGCASYLLIGFWFAREGIPSAATRAFLTCTGWSAHPCENRGDALSVSAVDSRRWLPIVVAALRDPPEGEMSSRHAPDHRRLQGVVDARSPRAPRHPHQSCCLAGPQAPPRHGDETCRLRPHRGDIRRSGAQQTATGRRKRPVTAAAPRPPA